MNNLLQLKMFIDTNRNKSIDETSRRAIMELYGVSRGDIDTIETDIVARGNMCTCQVVHIVEELHNRGCKPKNITINNQLNQFDPLMNSISFGTTDTTDTTTTTTENNNAFVIDEVVEEDTTEFDLKTTQNTVVIPTKELIKVKGTDFRVLMALSTISNVENSNQSGNNNRFVSCRKVDENMDNLTKTLGISPSQFRKCLGALIKRKSNEFKLVERMYKGKLVQCYQMDYESGGFVLVPVEKAKSLLRGGSNNCIKLYSNLLWLCAKDGEFQERELTQGHLAELMGLSKRSESIVKIATEWLEGAKLIKTRKVWESDTIIKDGMPIGSKPKSKIYYSIVLD